MNTFRHWKVCLISFILLRWYYRDIWEGEITSLRFYISLTVYSNVLYCAVRTDSDRMAESYQPNNNTLFVSVLFRAHKNAKIHYYHLIKDFNFCISLYIDRVILSGSTITAATKAAIFSNRPFPLYFPLLQNIFRNFFFLQWKNLFSTFFSLFWNLWDGYYIYFSGLLGHSWI